MEPSKALQATATSDTERDSDCHASPKARDPFLPAQEPRRQRAHRTGQTHKPHNQWLRTGHGEPPPSQLPTHLFLVAIQPSENYSGQEEENRLICFLLTPNPTSSPAPPRPASSLNWSLSLQAQRALSFLSSPISQGEGRAGLLWFKSRERGTPRLVE